MPFSVFGKAKGEGGAASYGGGRGITGGSKKAPI